LFALANFIVALTQILDLLLRLYFWILIIRALLSWVHPDPYHPLVRFLHAITEPTLAPLRRFLPRGLSVDLSPVAALLIIYFLRSFLVPTLYDLAGRLR
jgi:YggT family protein